MMTMMIVTDSRKWKYIKIIPKISSKLDLYRSVIHNAFNELWYKRAVDYHHHNPDSFVISVPLDSMPWGVTTITASHAIYKEMGRRKAAAAVVGVQMDYNKLSEKFLDATISAKVMNTR